VIGNIHYAPINDLAWCSNDMLIAGSSDGYCSVMTVSDSHLFGERLPNEQVEDETLRAHYEQLDTINLNKLEMQVKN